MFTEVKKTKCITVLCLIFMVVSAQASSTRGSWIIVDNQDAVDSGGSFGRTAPFGSIGNTNNFNNNHEYFRLAYTGDPIIYGAVGGAVPDGSNWLILDSRTDKFAWGRLGQSLGVVSEGGVYDWSIKIGDRTDTPLPGDYMFGLFSLEDGDLQEISVVKKSDLEPVSGVLTTNITWDSTGSGVDGKPLYFVVALNSSSGTSALQLLCDSVSVQTSGVEMVVNGGFESGIDSWDEIPHTTTWTFKNLPDGDYEVAATWLEYSNRDTTAPFTVNGVTNVFVNQREKPDQLLLNDDDSWVVFDSLGTFASDNGQLQVSLTPDSLTDYVIADAVAVRRITWTPEEFSENGSYEEPVLSAGGVTSWGTEVPGWITFGMTQPPLVFSDTYIPAAPAVPDGNQWGLLDFRVAFNGGGTLVQCLDTVDEGRWYQWRVTLGNRSDVGYMAPDTFGLYSVSNGVFVARSVKLAADVIMSQQSGTTQSFNVKWDSTGSGADGEQLYFRMDFPTYSGPSTAQLLIDDLKVNATYLPGTVILVY